MYIQTQTFRISGIAPESPGDYSLPIQKLKTCHFYFRPTMTTKSLEKDIIRIIFSGKMIFFNQKNPNRSKKSSKQLFRHFWKSRVRRDARRNTQLLQTRCQFYPLISPIRNALHSCFPFSEISNPLNASRSILRHSRSPYFNVARFKCSLVHTYITCVHVAHKLRASNQWRRETERKNDVGKGEKGKKKLGE